MQEASAAVGQCTMEGGPPEENRPVARHGQAAAGGGTEWRSGKNPLHQTWYLSGMTKYFNLAEPSCPYCPGQESLPLPPILSLPLDGHHGGIRVFPHPRPLYRIEGETERRAEIGRASCRERV